MRMNAVLEAWGTERFPETLRKEIERLGPEELPLQQGLQGTSHVAASPIQASILDITELANVLRAHVGIFYSGVDAGCSCADDPTPVSEKPEYCEVSVKIDKRTGDAVIALV